MWWLNFLLICFLLEVVVKEVVEKSLELLGIIVDLGLVFILLVFVSEYLWLMFLLKEYFLEIIIIGCGGGGIVGMN